jgi:hypothetical protein
MLRGLLAYGLLDHCLAQRHRVDYGLRNSIKGSNLGINKRVAVPYRAADVPSDRAEFSHPDACLIYTTLSYYNTGLTLEQLVEALRSLLDMKPNAREYFYNIWYKSTAGSNSTIDDIKKIDLTNSLQLQTLFGQYQFSVEAVNFWLNNCLFPQTKQYPQKMGTSAWHLLPQNAESIGFSGTNDNHRLLPLHVKQNEPESNSLRATNGEMLEKLLHCATVCLFEELETGGNEPIWKKVLTQAIKLKLNAIIDTGSLLAGTSNRSAAEFVAKIGEPRVASVVYFESGEDRWMVYDHAARSHTPKSMSPVHESDSFVIFDEARSRGSDMKLRPDACAALTLGLRLCKDKLMQGAGRMRQLGIGRQTLQMFCPNEIKISIDGLKGNSNSSITTEDVLQWVMHNTKVATLAGLAEWATHGLFYASTMALMFDDAKITDEVYLLSDLYEPVKQVETLARLIESRQGAYFARFV